MHLSRKPLTFGFCIFAVGMKYLRRLLWPFSLLYGLVVVIRNWYYDVGWFKSTEFNIPVISVGNLAVGGAGKSPMAEYMVRLLKDKYKIATLSRGYGRKTKGFVLADVQSTANEIGDEPAQFNHKFPDLTVAVCEDRVEGINMLIPNHNLVILDDAFQHRAVKPGLSILLFDYNKLTEPHLLLPAGDLREPFGGKMRAHVLIVSKCPANLTDDQQVAIAAHLMPYPYQPIFFSAINYLPLQRLSGENTEIKIDDGTTVFLLTGIAGTRPLLAHLKANKALVIHHKYPDHHRFSLKNISKLADEFGASAASKKVVVTTEKDAERLNNPELQADIAGLNILVLPISVQFLNAGGPQFDKTIINYVRKYTAHRRIH